MIPQYRINNNGNYDEYKVKIPKVVCMTIYYEKKRSKAMLRRGLDGLSLCCSYLVIWREGGYGDGGW